MRYPNTVIAALIAAFAGICLSGAAIAAEKSLDVGIVTARTGPLAAPGKFQLNGFQLAVDELNKTGGVKIGNDTYQLALKVYDTHCNAAEGASAKRHRT
jgi:branched-chain amino acid transport system substrate-binding protein